MGHGFRTISAHLHFPSTRARELWLTMIVDPERYDDLTIYPLRDPLPRSRVGAILEALGGVQPSTAADSFALHTEAPADVGFERAFMLAAAVVCAASLGAQGELLLLGGVDESDELRNVWLRVEDGTLAEAELDEDEALQRAGTLRR